MKYILLIITILVFIFIFTRENKFVYDTQNNTFISFNDFINKINKYDVICFGELHNNNFAHTMELKILESLYKKNNNIALALEMFERDVQEYLDNYLKNKIDEQVFLKNTRPWSNYNTDYKPLIEFCKTNNIPAIASNIPRRYAAVIAKNGTLKDSNKLFYDIPYKECAEYKQLFFETMKDISMSNSPMKKNMNIDNMFLAQLYKDATMAHSINNFLKKYKEFKILFICGEFHSNYKLGTIEQLKYINDSLFITNISIADSLNNIDKDKSDFILIKNKFE